MPLTPADVHNVVFKKPPIGKRASDRGVRVASVHAVAGVLTIRKSLVGYPAATGSNTLFS